MQNIQVHAPRGPLKIAITEMIENMPKIKPAKHNGENVNVRFSYPIVYKGLENTDNQLYGKVKRLDINKNWQSGYKQFAYGNEYLDCHDCEKRKIYSIDGGIKDFIKGKTFQFTDSVGNSCFFKFEENFLTEFVGKYKAKIDIEYDKNGYDATDPLLSKLIPRDVVTHRPVPRIINDFGIFKTDSGLVLTRYKSTSNKRILGIYGELMEVNQNNLPKIDKEKEAFLHTTEALYPYIPYRFYFNSPYSDLIENIVNGNFEDLTAVSKNPWIRLLHNYVLYEMGNRYKESLPKDHITLPYTIVVTETNAFNQVVSEKDYKIEVYLEARFKNVYKKYEDTFYFSQGVALGQRYLIEYFFQEKDYNDPILVQFRENLYRYTNNLEPKKWGP